MIASIFRFHTRGSLRWIYRNGQTKRSQYAVLRYVNHPKRTSPRVAVVVSKKVHKSAVGRNKIRRRIYEIFRHELPKLRPATDIVCIVTSAELRTLPSNEVNILLKQLLKQAGLYKKPPQSSIITRSNKESDTL